MPGYRLHATLQRGGGRLGLARRSGGRLKVSPGRTAEGFRSAVSDTGAGISAERLPRLFQEFSQADASSTREKGGLGLGPSIARALVEAPGGGVGAESAPARGAPWCRAPRRAAPVGAQPTAPRSIAVRRSTAWGATSKVA